MKTLIIEDNHFWSIKLQILAEKCGLDVIATMPSIEDAKIF